MSIAAKAKQLVRGLITRLDPDLNGGSDVSLRGARLGVEVLRARIAYNRYGGYCVPLSSRGKSAAKKVLAGNVYEPNTIEYMVRNCGTGDVVHAGAYFGDFLPALSRGMAPDAKLWAFEPNAENYRCAMITAEINMLRNVEIAGAGLGSCVERRRLVTRDEQGCSLGGGSRVVSEDFDGSSEQVEIVAVDGIVHRSRHVSIVQLDVEGYEEQALQGALRTIGRCKPILILEVLPDSGLLSGDWFSNNILSLGYVFDCRLHGNVVFRCNG